MGYIIVRRGASGWRLRHRKDAGRGRVACRDVEKDSREARSLGIVPSLSEPQARARLVAHRADRRSTELAEQHRRIKARVDRRDVTVSAWLPPDIVSEFETVIMADENVPARQWRAAKRLIVAVDLDPSEWRFRKKAVWRWFVEQRYSPDYAWRILRATNLFQALCCARRQKAWSDVPMMDGPALAALRRANFAHRNGRQETFPLTLELLAAGKKLMSPEEHAWQAVSLWFGLRVEEMALLVPAEAGKSWRVERSADGQALHVLQWKQVRKGIPPDKAWKAIPANEPEQRELLTAIERGVLKQPSGGSIKKVHPRLSPRSGRAYFVTLMRERGWDEYDASQWLGHKNIATTRRSYESVHVVQWGRRRTG